MYLPSRSGWRPRLDPRTVRRTHALRRLAEGRERRLTTVVAGPGWGKTTALAQFAQDQSVPTVWLQLSDAENNVSAFALLLSRVIAAEFPGFGAGLAPQLAGIPSPAENWRVIARMVAAEVVDTLPAPFVLILDDYHFVAADDAVNRFLAALIEALPDHVHLIIASRQEAPSILARVRADACHLDEDDLRFSETEGAAYLHLWASDAAGSARMARYVRELEGWPLGMALLADHLRVRGPVDHLPAALPVLFDYLSEEALRRESPEMQDLLLTAAVPERFSPTLLRDALGREVADPIDALARRHLFVTRLDGTGEWYRFHQLFRAYLHWRLERTRPVDARRELERRMAAAWHALGDEQEALRHELAAAAYEDAIRTLVGLAPAFIASGQWLTLRGWLERAPSVVVAERPDLLIYLAECHFIDRRLDECRYHAGRALDICEQRGDRAGLALVLELLIRSYAGEDTRADHLSAVALLERYRPYFSYDYPLYAHAAAEAACALADLDRFAEAGELFRWASDHPAGQTGAHAPVVCFYGFYYHLPQGRLDTALAYLRTTYHGRHRRDGQSFLPFATVYLAIALFHAGHANECRRVGMELMELAEARGMQRTFHASMAAILGLVALDGGDKPEARARSALFEHWRARGEHRIWGESWGDVLRAGLAAADGDTALFIEWAGRAVASARAQGSSFREAEVLTALGRLASRSAAVRRSAPHYARDALLHAIEAAERIDARYSQARAHLLLASVMATDADGAARDHLEAALRLSMEHSFDALWTRHERALAEQLLERAAAWALHPAYARQLALLPRPEPARDAAPALRIVTLGRFEVSAGGEEIGAARWGRPRVKTMFKYLLSAPNHHAHRQVLTEALWPDLDPDAARSNLNNTVYRLRRALEPDLDPRRPSRFLIAEGAGYRLAFGSGDHWDVDAFLHGVEAARQSDRDADYAAATELYGGDYLPDELYDDWALAPREWLRGEYERLLRDWGASVARQGELARAIEVTERLLRHDPAREATHRALMDYYRAAGQRDHALRQYRRCTTALRRELGVDPDTETTALYHRILHS